MTTVVRHEGEIVATVGATRYFLAPSVEALPPAHRKRRIVILMCAYALDIRQGSVAESYSDADALAVALDALEAE